MKKYILVAAPILVAFAGCEDWGNRNNDVEQRGRAAEVVQPTQPAPQQQPMTQQPTTQQQQPTTTRPQGTFDQQGDQKLTPAQVITQFKQRTANDPRFKNVQIVQSGDQLILRGNVASEDIAEQAEDIVQDITEDIEVQNTLVTPKGTADPVMP